jgi:hypothetical protein
LSSRCQIHPNQISRWKQELTASSANIFKNKQCNNLPLKIKSNARNGGKKINHKTHRRGKREFVVDISFCSFTLISKVMLHKILDSVTVSEKTVYSFLFKKRMSVLTISAVAFFFFYFFF